MLRAMHTRLRSRSQSGSSRSGGPSDRMSTCSVHQSSNTNQPPEEINTVNVPPRILTELGHIVPQSREERDALRALRDRAYGRTKAFEASWLQCTGMDDEFEAVFEAVGWENFWESGKMGLLCSPWSFL